MELITCNNESMKMNGIERRVGYIYSVRCLQLCDKLPKIQSRASLVHGLIESYDLLPSMKVIEPKIASRRDLESFHSSAYLDCLIKASSSCEDDDELEDYSQELEEFGLSYDCPVYRDLYETVCLLAGSSLSAADAILSSSADVVINWFGGWHHAKRFEASGFCYVNDIVLCIQRLRQRFERVLYVDLDLHHGDGVESAFSFTDKVLTFSIHKFFSGFFPGSGNIDSIGIGKGKHYTVNAPLVNGIDDGNYVSLFNRMTLNCYLCQEGHLAIETFHIDSSIMKTIESEFKPDVIVCQCGADGLTGDPHAAFNLTTSALTECVLKLLQLNLPSILLGGGGYNFANTARCWTELTALTLNRNLNEDIPEHDYFAEYGPSYELAVHKGNMPNGNSSQYINELSDKLTCSIRKISQTDI